MRSNLRYAVFLVILALTTGCGGDEPALPALDTGPVVFVELDAAAAGFTNIISQVQIPIIVVEGPFSLRGSNIRYDGTANRLLVDLTITHNGNTVLADPVRLRMLAIQPAGVTGLDDLSFEFPFANDDVQWTPGETSLPLTLSFAVDAGVKVVFFAELGAGFARPAPVEDGTISGTVWLDHDANGLRGAGELGAIGIMVELFDGAADPDVDSPLALDLTDNFGAYSFADLPVGQYTLRVKPQPGLVVTTTAELAPSLPEVDGGVGAVGDLDFGIVLEPSSSVSLEVAADTMVRSDVTSRTNDNHGADAFLGVGTDKIRTLLRFDLASVQAPVVSARLEMTIAHYISGSGQTYELEINRVVDSADRTPWIEGNGSEVTPAPSGGVWVNEAEGVAWFGAGDGGDANNQSQPDFDPFVYASVPVVQNNDGAGDVITWDITALVNGWINGDYPNHGLFVRDVFLPSTFRQVWFGSRDALLRGYTDPRVAEGPRLVLDLE